MIGEDDEEKDETKTKGKEREDTPQTTHNKRHPSAPRAQPLQAVISPLPFVLQ